MRKFFEEGYISAEQALHTAICHGSTTAIMFVVTQLNAVITGSDLFLMSKLVNDSPGSIRESNNLRLAWGLVGSNMPSPPMLVNQSSVANNILSQPPEEIRNSEEYKEWTAPFQFKKHRTLPIVERLTINKQIKRSLSLGVVFAVIGTVLLLVALLAAPYLLIPAAVGYGVASILLSLSIDLKLKKSSLDRQISKILTPSPRPETNPPTVRTDLSYVRSIAPFIAIAPPAAKASHASSSQGDSKRAPQARVIESAVESSYTPSVAPRSMV